MQYRKTLLSVCLLPVLFVAGCGSDNPSAQDGSSLSQSSSKKGVNKMPTQSPMLNEIFAIKQNEVPRGQAIDVSHIVTRYIPIGTSREQTKKILNEMNHYYSEEGDVIHAGYFKQIHPFVPAPAVLIELKFNTFNYLENMETKFHYVE